MAQLKFNSILVVCTGNICRSPIGERLLRKRLPGVKVNSAGVHGLVKHPADATAADVAANHGVSLEGHAGRKLTEGFIQMIHKGFPGHWKFFSFRVKL